ncbi:MAG: hypothetical protein EON52_13195 [Actinomycetales bacterium]|nr:MAG: hypothetical protein EON52_13195 [Actinomycetales bacterium]
MVPLTGTRQAAGRGDITLDLAPYQSRLLVMSPGLSAAGSARPLRPLLDLSTGWKTTLRAPPPGTSWTSVAALRHYSGAIRYSRGREAGTVWAAPWQINIGPFLRPGQNCIDVTVMSGATNALSARTPPDRRLLTMRYGERFVDQDRDKVAPAPSGLLGRITLNGVSSDAP